ncbi:UDP-N-acetyl-glucosamine-1-P transferase Alg7 [Coccidioides immitis RS]|uniref:UDP-N-acetylglucosamine--dolichyl-phosphate N-acetylglucosaminephosphotransferase n=3 Tax=Coccidioides immitis TaxID=5501 RepID=J3K518_COCIM|nr:UDP-N-acetyl-glucosamine-1-P transferase Alg7 [Coccidioides immitis RS]EAS29460.3 UDP-N-acetyl-glucosamine-1-P transferase Alg7 [Coccidioides immitis RS]TPX22461.1 UDP-N-acetylglucosamine--dolichyl-phosphate N-acetylglucosaminephosphotransferase [Coccidioides immitis]
MITTLTHRETWSLLTVVVACFGIIVNTFQGDGEPLIASLALSGIAFAAAFGLIRWLGAVFMKAGLKGKDMSKVKQAEIPETMGAVCAIVYILAIIVFIPFPFYKDIVAATSGGGNRDVVLPVHHVETGRLLHRFPHNKLASYLSGLLSLQSIVILGFGDDLLDIRWRHKVLIPAFAAIPMLIVYFVDFGVTQVVVPVPLQSYLGPMIDLGWMYYVYMAAVAIFCPNSINMLAGINGIEVSQSIVIAILLIANDSLYLAPITPYPHPATDSHLFSIYLLLPFIAVSLALWWHNWYPAKVFVGDTYCYFAGMVFAVVGILGHFSKTLLLLFIPQIFNFLYSTPQLFHLIPCPRHRLPRFSIRTGLLEPSVTEWQRPPTKLIAVALEILHRLHLVRIKKNEQGEIVESTNLTLLNLWLIWFGPLREDKLAMHIVGLQFFCGFIGLLARHKLALWVFREDNRGFGSNLM